MAVYQAKVKADSLYLRSALTGLTLELPPEPEPAPTTGDPDAATMEAALNELGVITRE